ncbi:serine O-acetyltransferase [Nanchangia anserum]|uniref:Serine acetyltransferase n=1 Tax=Nanchangia anserum TaxID=2692125 RepID=A0A8I0KPG8_9ACTO|nr:serine O-acetyltransferase [Nanchangia anserum]MBD3688880.1 serine O-acetyltransferase [Nanchangia anserum]QOX81147.1 serine O-acetyltransferase [Nanchangia anserum]
MACPGLAALMREDVDAVLAHDPAASSRLEIALTYPGVHAVWCYRLAHCLWQRGHRLSARIISAWARVGSGVDIHPAARLGRRLFIDHANGVVIGATTEVGDDCVLFHQVTLGGVAMTPGKRHPTLGDRVMVGAGAKVLGPITVGSGAKIAANAVVVKDVPEGCVAIGVPAQLKQTTPKQREHDVIIDPSLYI